jgi:nucleoside-diphosphate-sugar epimerase
MSAAHLNGLCAANGRDDAPNARASAGRGRGLLPGFAIRNLDGQAPRSFRGTSHMTENRLAADLDHVLDRTRGLWEELRGERLFLTGGTGFFGRWLLESFAWANNQLGLHASALVLTRNPEAFRRKATHLAKQPSIRFLQGDIRSFEFPSGSFSHIIHAAAESNAKINREDPQGMTAIIVEGTRRTLDFARSCGARRFLLTSSGAVYGNQPPEMTHIPEEYSDAPDPSDPGSIYGLGKRAAEELCRSYADQTGIEMKIARGFAFAGPYLPLDAHFAIGNFIRDALKGGPIVVQGDGTPRRSYLYAADLAVWLWTILLRGRSLRPYNIGSENDVTIRGLAEAVAHSFQPAPEIQVLRQAAPGAPAQRYVPSTKRAASELGLRESVDLPDAIRRTIAWARTSDQ